MLFTCGRARASIVSDGARRRRDPHAYLGELGLLLRVQGRFAPGALVFAFLEARLERRQPRLAVLQGGALLGDLGGIRSALRLQAGARRLRLVHL